MRNNNETNSFLNVIDGLYSNINFLNDINRLNLTASRDETLKELVFKSDAQGIITALTEDSKRFFQQVPSLQRINRQLVNADAVQTSALQAHICLKLHKANPQILRAIQSCRDADTLFTNLTSPEAKLLFGDFATNEARIKPLLSQDFVNAIKRQAENTILIKSTNTLQDIENALNTNRDLDPISKSTLALRHFKLKTHEIAQDAVEAQGFTNPIRLSIYQYRQELLETDNASAVQFMAQHFLALYTEKFAHLDVDRIKALINAPNTEEFKTNLTAFMDNTFQRGERVTRDKVRYGNYIKHDDEALALKQAMLKGFIQTKIMHGTPEEIEALRNGTQNLTSFKAALNSMGITQTALIKEEFIDYTKKTLETLDKQVNTTQLITLLNSNDYAYKSANAHKALQAVFNGLSSKEQAAALAKFASDPLTLPRLLQAETPEAIKYFLQVENVAIEAPLLEALVLENQKLKSLIHLKNHALASIFADLGGDFTLSPEQATALTNLIYNDINAVDVNGLGDSLFENSFNAILMHIPEEIRNNLRNKIKPFLGQADQLRAEKSYNARLMFMAGNPLQTSLVNYLMSLHKTTVLTTEQFQTILFAFTHAKTIAEFKKSLSAVAEFNKLPAANRPAFAQPENALFKNMTEGEFQTLKNQSRSVRLNDNAEYNAVFHEESLKMRTLEAKLSALKAEYASLDFNDITEGVDNLLNPAFVKKATITALKEGYKTLAEYAANQVLFLEKKKNDLTQYQNELKALFTGAPDANKRHAIRAQLNQIQELQTKIDAELKVITPVHVALSKAENPDESVIARIERQETDNQSRYLTLKKTYGYRHNTRAMNGSAQEYTSRNLVGSYNLAQENRIVIQNEDLLLQERMYKNELPLKSGQFYVHSIDCGPDKVAEITEEITPSKISYRVPSVFQPANRNEQFKQAHQMVLIHLTRFATEPNKDNFKITVGPHSDNQFIADMMVLYKKLGPSVGFKMNKVNFVGYNPTKETLWGSYTGCAEKAQATLDEFMNDGNKNLLLTDSTAALKQMVQDNKEAPKHSEKLSERFKLMNTAIRNSDQSDILEEKNVNYTAPKPH